MPVVGFGTTVRVTEICAVTKFGCSGICDMSAVVVELVAPSRIVMPPGNDVPALMLAMYTLLRVSSMPMPNGLAPAGTFAVT